MAFYVGSNGSFVCKAKAVLGRMKCDIVGILHDGNENCFVKDGRAFCAEADIGQDLVLDGDTDIQINGQNAREIRKKRQITEPSNTASVISVALYFNKVFMDRFKAINNGDYAAAVQDVEEYGILVGNEWTYRYQTLKQYPGGLDVVVNIAEIVYPAENQDFSFMAYDGEGRTDTNSIAYFYQEPAVEALFTGGTAHHAMLITGLGVKHDGNANQPLAAGCTNGAHIMSKTTYTDISAGNKDTYYTFSQCSSDMVIAHLNTHGNCLHSVPIDFLDKFCLGPRGIYTSLNEQCELSHGPGWATCDTSQVKATASECWTQSSVECCLNGDQTISNRKMIQLVYDGTPCVGVDPSTHYYCYLGNCVAGDTICDAPINPSQAPTTHAPTTAPTTQGPTTTAPTTQAPTTAAPTTQAPTTQAPTTTTSTTHAPTTTAPTTQAPSTTPASCECSEQLCRKLNCLHGNNICCESWMSDMLHAISELQADLNL